MTQKTLKVVIEQSFIKHDENKNGGIEFGGEFDSFLADLLAYMPENGNIKGMPKDKLRQVFGKFDVNGDGRVTFEEFWPKALATFRVEGYIIDVNEIEIFSQKEIEIGSQKTDQSFVFEESDICGDESAPVLKPLVIKS